MFALCARCVPLNRGAVDHLLLEAGIAYLGTVSGPQESALMFGQAVQHPPPSQEMKGNMYTAPERGRFSGVGYHCTVGLLNFV